MYAQSIGAELRAATIVAAWPPVERRKVYSRCCLASQIVDNARSPEVRLHVAATHANGIEAMRMYLLHSHGAGAATSADEAAAVWPATRPSKTTSCSSYHPRPAAADAHSHPRRSADSSASSSASQTTADT